MRILIMCDRYPDSYQDGLLLRVLHLARHLHRPHQLDLVCYHDPARPRGEADYFRRVWTVPPPGRQVEKGWLAPFTGWRVRDFYPRSEALKALLEEEIDPRDYDVVWDAGAAMFPHLTARWSDRPVLGDLVDDAVLTTERALGATTKLKQRLRLLKYLSLYYRFERYVMRRVTHCCVVTEEDAARFRRVSPHVPVSVVQNGVDLEYFAPSDAPAVPGRLVFEGSMAFGPNRRAVSFLVTEVMPLVWARRPEVTLTLVGRDPPSEVRALASDRVVVAGSVPDVRPYVHDAEIFVCPMLSGAGIKNKLLQAWAMGKAVIATSLSVGGLNARDGDNVLIRDGAQGIASSIVDLLDDPSLRRALGSRGRETVIGQYAWEARARAFEDLLGLAAAEHPRLAALSGDGLHAHRG